MQTPTLLLAAACLLTVLSSCRTASTPSTGEGTMIGDAIAGRAPNMAPEDIALVYLKPPQPETRQAFDPVWWMNVSAPYLSPKLYLPLSEWMRLYCSEGVGSADRLFAGCQSHRQQVYFSDDRTVLMNRSLGGNPLYMHFDIKDARAKVVSQTRNSAEVLLSGGDGGGRHSAKLIFRNAGVGWQLEDAIIQEGGTTWSALTRLRERLEVLRK